MGDIIKHSIYSETEFITDKVLFKYQIISISDNDYENLNIIDEKNKILKLLKDLEEDVQTYLNENPSMELHEGLVMVPLRGNKKRFYQVIKQKSNYDSALRHYYTGNYMIELLSFNNDTLEAKTITEQNYMWHTPIGSLISMNEGQFIAQAFYQENSTNGGKKNKKDKKNRKTRKKAF